MRETPSCSAAAHVLIPLPGSHRGGEADWPAGDRPLTPNGGRGIARLVGAVIALRIGTLWSLLVALDLPAEINKAIERWFESELNEAFKAFRSRSTFAALIPHETTEEETRRLNRELTQQLAEDQIDRYGEQYRDADYSSAAWVAELIAREAGVSLEPHSQPFEQLCKRIMEARGLVEDARIRWPGGDIEFRPNIGTAPQVAVAKATSPDLNPEVDLGPPLSTAIRDYIAFIAETREKPSDK